ncbi:MAG TPA: hypothetical protein VFZ25_09855 [Chloroflexota bacterium]|nr:hypothetical protein [Chloroflexota bacterium]
MSHQYRGPEISNPIQGHGLKVIVDTANVAYENQNGPNEKAKVENVLLMRQRLLSLGFCPIFIADASLRYNVDEPHKFDHLEQSGQIMQSPAGTEADYFCLSLAERDTLPVVSNDFYRDRELEFPIAARELRVPFMIVDNQVILEQEQLRKAVALAHNHHNDFQHCHDTGQQHEQESSDEPEQPEHRGHHGGHHRRAS